MTAASRGSARVPSYCVALTATVNPKGMTYVALTETGERERQYLTALQDLLECCPSRVASVVFAENSGADLSRFHELAGHFAARRPSVELLSFNQNDFPRELGKGYGEFHLLDSALRASSAARSATHFVKLTGRLRVANLARILRKLPAEFDFAGDFSPPSASAPEGMMDTRLFAARTAFFLPKLAGLADRMDDSRGRIAERVIYDAARTWTDARIVALLPCEPRWRGASGSHGARYDSPRQRLKYPLKATRRFLRRLRWGKGGGGQRLFGGDR
jgi:hypothetical protein